MIPDTGQGKWGQEGLQDLHHPASLTGAALLVSRLLLRVLLLLLHSLYSVCRCSYFHTDVLQWTLGVQESHWDLSPQT